MVAVSDMFGSLQEWSHLMRYLSPLCVFLLSFVAVGNEQEVEEEQESENEEEDDQTGLSFPDTAIQIRHRGGNK